MTRETTPRHSNHSGDLADGRRGDRTGSAEATRRRLLEPDISYAEELLAEWMLGFKRGPFPTGGPPSIRCLVEGRDE